MIRPDPMYNWYYALDFIGMEGLVDLGGARTEPRFRQLQGTDVAPVFVTRRQLLSSCCDTLPETTYTFI